MTQMISLIDWPKKKKNDLLFLAFTKWIACVAMLWIVLIIFHPFSSVTSDKIETDQSNQFKKIWNKNTEKEGENSLNQSKKTQEMEKQK